MSSASHDTPVEWGWFAPCCEDDFEFLGVPDPSLASTPEHVRDVVLAAEAAGFQNILLPSGFNTGVDAWVMACALAPQTSTISLLPAIRVGEHHPPMMARATANLDHMLNGRLNINIISSPLAGLPPESSAVRYERTQEFMHVLKAFWQQPHVEYSGRYFQYDLKSDIPRPVRLSGPPLYFGGASPQAKEAAAAQADVYLFWGDTVEMIGSGIEEMQSLAARHNRELLFGLRIHVIARETEEEAKDAAQRLISKLSDETGDALKQRALDKSSAGKARQNELVAQGEWAEEFLWTGIGRGRPGCGTAIVGSYDQVETKLRAYIDAGVRAFILSGYPHLDEAQRFGEHVLPRFAQTTCARLLQSTLQSKA
jgi:alkanesulfonate monooxygenase